MFQLWICTFDFDCANFLFESILYYLVIINVSLRAFLFKKKSWTYFSGLSFTIIPKKKKKSHELFSGQKKMGSVESHLYEQTGRWQEDYLATSYHL